MSATVEVVEVLGPPPMPPAERDAPGGRTLAGEGARRARLERTWGGGRGLLGWFTAVDHKSIAKRYLVTTFVFFCLAGIEAALMRLQLSRPENRLIGPDRYNQLFTTHGTTMLFLFAVPTGEAIGLYLVPLMVGTRNVSFPRLNAYGYFTFLIGGLFINIALLLNTGPDAGWFAYVPLSGPEYSPGKRVDVWAQMITFTEIAAITSGIEIITTAFKQRAPGMTLNRVPALVWALVVASFVVLFAMPVVATASQFLAFDRLVGTHFFNTAEGGDPLLWQHLFWFFGHPEVYIIFIPALGVMSSVVATFSRRPLFGYPAVVLSQVAIGFLSFGLWVHHMFATPLPQLGQSFFTAASAMIAVPTGVQIFCWLATMASGRPRFAVPMLYALGFIFLFMIGGLSGLFLASVPVDTQLTDTYFVPGHIHYVLLGGMVFPLFAGFHFWFPKVTGRMLSEALGRWEFGLFFAGVNVTFFPFLLLALQGMPRRVYTYLPETGWGPLALVSTCGVALLAAAILLFIANVVRSLRSGAIAGADPWGGETLEWATSSPPPVYNYADIPVVEGRSPLWEGGAVLPVVEGLDETKREVLVTTVMDAVPDVRHEQPGPTLAPLLTAVATAVTFVSGIFTPWGFVVGAVCFIPGLVLWAWPRGVEPEHHDVVEVPRGVTPAVAAGGGRGR